MNKGEVMKASVLSRLVGFAMIIIPVVAHAELYVCRGELNGVPALAQYFFRDPSFGRPDGCYQVPDELTAQNFDLITTFQSRLDYLEVNSIDGTFGFVQEKDQVGKDEADAAAAATAGQGDEFKNELKNSPYCNAAHLGQVDALIDQLQQQGDPTQPVKNDKGILRCLISLIRLRGVVD
jgi:hypothetical protein